MGVALRHARRGRWTPPHHRGDLGECRAVLKQPSYARVPQVVETASGPGFLASFGPCGFPRCDGFSRITAVGFGDPTGVTESHALTRKYEVCGFPLGKLLSPASEGNGGGCVQWNRPACAALANGTKRTRADITALISWVGPLTDTGIDIPISSTFALDDSDDSH